MKIVYFDCFHGISGDMILGALLDGGLSGDELINTLKLMELPPWEMKIEKKLAGALMSTDVAIIADEHDHHHHDDHHHHSRSYREIYEIISSSKLPEDIKEKSILIFKNLALAEAGIHGKTIDEIHFHEVGGLDSIIDIVGAVTGLKILGIEEVYSSSLPWFSGNIQTMHGTLPLPAPATIALLKGVPFYPTDIKVELITPTGAAILSTLAKSFGPPPDFKVHSTGYGKGKRDIPEPNVLRIFTGERDKKKVL